MAESVKPVNKAKRGGPVPKKGGEAEVIPKQIGAAEEKTVESFKDNPPALPKVKRSRPKRGQKNQPVIKEEDVEDSVQGGTLDQKLDSLSLGQVTLKKADQKEKDSAILPIPSEAEEEVKQIKSKAGNPRDRPRKAAQDKKNGSLDVSGLDLAFTYFSGIHYLAKTGDVNEMEKMREMAEQGMETIQATLAVAKDE